MTDQAAGLPFATMGVPGRDVGLEMYLNQAPDGTAALLAVPYRITGTNADGTPVVQSLFPVAVAPGETGTSPDVDFSITLRSVGAYSLLIAKQDPGQGIVWLAFGSLILGLLITFYLPRRRVWTRLSPAGELAIVGRADRYVDFEREFGRLLDDLVAHRNPGSGRVRARVRLPGGGLAVSAATPRGSSHARPLAVVASVHLIAVGGGHLQGALERHRPGRLVARGA